MIHETLDLVLAFATIQGHGSTIGTKLNHALCSGATPTNLDYLDWYAFLPTRDIRDAVNWWIWWSAQRIPKDHHLIISPFLQILAEASATLTLGPDPRPPAIKGPLSFTCLSAILGVRRNPWVTKKAKNTHSLILWQTAPCRHWCRLPTVIRENTHCNYTFTTRSHTCSLRKRLLPWSLKHVALMWLMCNGVMQSTSPAFNEPASFQTPPKSQ